MPADSLIRLRQLNQPEVSGYIKQVVPHALRATGINITGTGVLPTGSGTHFLGSDAWPWLNIHSKAISVPSGSGIWFGSTFVTAYTSGSNAIIRVGDYTFNSSPTGLSIIGPSGATGPTGATGATGVSGISVTGITGVGGTGMRLLFSNGSTSNSIPLASGATGATGISLTGFSQTGYIIKPLYSNGTTGSGITLPTGQQGRQGKAGGIVFDISDFTGFGTGSPEPKAFIYDIDAGGLTYNPDLSLIKGMTYNIGYSGLALTGVTITGNGIDYQTGLFESNYFVESGITGYLKFCLFSDDATDLYGNLKTGRYIRQDYPQTTAVYADILAKVVTESEAYNIEEHYNRGEIDFTLKLGASSALKYGFQKYNFYTQEPIDQDGAWGFYVLGDIEASYFGPAGPSGATGPQGLAGSQGERGLKGTDGTPGASITGVDRSANNIRFALSNGLYTDYIALPSGGPTGPTGPSGSQGPSGVTGPTGPQGAAGMADTYAATFDYWDTTFSGSGQTLGKRASGSSSWSGVTGDNRRFAYGDEISFQNSALVGKAYTVYQKLLFADTPYTRSQYFYGEVTDFNSALGSLSFVVSNSPTGIGLSGNQITWYRYNIIDLNLGGLGSPGPSGATGQQGVKGDTGNPLFCFNTGCSGITANQTTIIDFTGDAIDLFITGATNMIQFNYNRFNVGQTMMLRVANSGVVTNTALNPLIQWGTGEIRFPYGASAPAPSPSTACIYTFVRWPNYNNVPNPRVFCTYSVEYPL
jgi:collagen type VII alpha